MSHDPGNTGEADPPPEAESTPPTRPWQVPTTQPTPPGGQPAVPPGSTQPFPPGSTQPFPPGSTQPVPPGPVPSAPPQGGWGGAPGGQQPYPGQPPAYGSQQPYPGQPPTYGGHPPYPPYPGAPGPYPGAAPQQWHHLPPEDLIRLHKPGVIPLRPLKLGDIFSGAVLTMRRNPEATIGMAVLVLAVFLVPSLLISLATRSVTSLAPEDWQVLATLAPTVFAAIATLALSGFVIYVVSEAALGDRVGIGQTWRAVRGRLLALLGVTLLTGLVVGGGFLLIVLVVIAMASAIGGAGILLGVLVVLASIPLVLWLSAKVALGPAAVVLERAGPARGIARSWALTSGGQAWRVLGIILLAGLLANIFGTAVTLPISFAVFALLELVTGDPSALLTGTVVAEHIVQLVVNAVVTPFTAGVTALLYLDQRIRREGLDLTMIRAAQERAAARRA